MNKPKLSLTLLLFFTLLSIPRFSAAQTAQWSKPENISASQTDSLHPAIAADPGGGVHLVWVEKYPTGDAILYTVRDAAGWASPIDIIAAAGGSNPGHPVLGCDTHATLHLAFLGTGIEYTNVYAPLAGSARNWRTPVTVAPTMNYLSAPDLAIGPDDRLHLVYAIQNGLGSGVYYTSSADGGLSWLNPQLVYENSNSERMVDLPRVAASPDGSVHIVWVEQNYPETFPPIGIRYSKSMDGTLWGAPQSLADGPYYDPEILVNGEQEIHVVWSGTDTDRYKFHRWSRDGGENWLQTWRDEALGGLQGLPGLVADSAGRIYWLTVGSIFNRPDLPDANPDHLYESVFNNGVWSGGTILLGSSVTTQNMGAVSVAVALGNELHTALMVPFDKPDGSYQMDIIHLVRTLATPALAPVTLSEPTATPQLAASPTPTEAPQPTHPSFANAPAATSKIATNIPLLAALPVVLLILGLILVTIRRRR